MLGLLWWLGMAAERNGSQKGLIPVFSYRLALRNWKSGLISRYFATARGQASVLKQWIQPHTIAGASKTSTSPSVSVALRMCSGSKHALIRTSLPNLSEAGGSRRKCHTDAASPPNLPVLEARGRKHECKLLEEPEELCDQGGPAKHMQWGP